MNLFTKIKHNIATSPPANWLVRKSKTTSLPGFRGIPLFDVINFFIGQVKTVGIQERAAAIAFNLIMAIPPAIIFLFTLIPFLPISEKFQQSMYGLIRDVVPGEKDHSVLIGFLSDFINRPRTGLLSLGFVLSMFFSSNAIMGIMRSFDKNYFGFRKRTELQKRGAALKITMILFFLVLTSILFLVGQGAVLEFMVESPTIRGIIVNARWIIIVLLFFASISYIYRHTPSVHKYWRPVVFQYSE